MTGLLLLLLLFIAVPGHAATYYVSTSGSGSTCSLASPCSSFSTAFGKLSAGDTLYLRGGSYSTRIYPGDFFIPSGTSGSPITIAGYPTETVTLTAGIALQGNLDASIPQYITFDRLIIQNTNDSAFSVGATCHHIQLTNSEAQTFGSAGSMNVIVIGSSTTYVSVIGSNIHGAPIGLDFGEITGHYGFYANGNHMLIDRNIIHDNTGYGIHMFLSGGHLTSSDNTVSNNIIYGNCTDDGVRNQSANAVIISNGSNDLVYNNIIYNNTGVTCAGALSISLTDNAMVYNNTIYNNAGEAITVNTTAANPKVQNNILYNNTTNQISDYGSTNPTIDHNLLTNPLFTNAAAGDFTLQSGSGAIDTGVTIGSFSTDKIGIARPQGNAWDRGAYEFTGNAGPTPTTFYVATTGLDSRSCLTASDISTPRQTIAGGIACLVLPGSTLYLRGGTYVETVDTNTQFIPAGTSWNAATSIRAYGTETVTLQIPVGSTNPSLLFFRNATNDHYLILDRLILDCNNVTSSNALVTYPGTDHIRFQNGEMKNCFFEDAFLYYSNNVEILSSLIHASSGYYGIALAGTIDGVILNKNTIYSNGRGGIDLMKDPVGVPTNTTITQNTVHNNSTSVNSSGIRLGSTGNTGNQVYNNLLYGEYEGITIGSGASSSKVYNNTVYGSTSNGINIMAGATGTLLKNSISYGNSGTAILDNGTSTTQTTNQTTDPTFTSAGTADFTLVNTSTAIDTGTNVAEVTIDIIDVTRPQRTTQSKGAYEFVGTPGQPPPPPLPAGSARYSPGWRPRFFLHR